MATPTRITASTCPYCGVGCGVLVESDGDRITGVRGDPDHPANAGRLCSKGMTLHLTARAEVAAQTRLLHPARRPVRGAALARTTWDEALAEAARRIVDIVVRDGADAVGVYVSGQLLTEDYYVFNKLVKGLLGTNHIDTNSRLCMSSAVAGYKRTLGMDAPPCCYDDLALAHTVFIAGSNTAWAHPVLFRRLEEARRARPGQRWIVVDPRRTETAEQADLHLQLLPGSDVALFHGLLHAMLWEGLVDHAFIAAHTTGYAALRERVRECTPAATARATGCREDDIVQAARWFGDSPATLSLYCQGLNQSSSGTDKNAALINLHLATGQIGKPGAGPFSLTGQPNAMGGREVGGLANLLSAHRDLANPADRAEVARLWGVPDVPATPGRTALEMFEAAADGEVKALWIACTNPAQSLPDQSMVRRALERAEFVLLQEAFAGTATAQFADLLLPATTWGEKDGTVTNSERRISRVRPAIAAPGQARHDWAIAADIAQRLAVLLAPDDPAQRARRQAMFDYPSPESIWNEHRESTRGRDLDITGMSYRLLEQTGPQQWPLPEGATQGRARLYTDGIFPTPDGRARFADVAPRGLAEARSAAYPFALNTGRLRDQWHGMSRTGIVGRLFGHDPQPAIELHPQELQRLRVAPGEPVRVRSRRGELVLPARSSPGVAPAQAFIAMHWGGEVLAGRAGQAPQAGPTAGINALTSPARCPVSRQPELKHAAVAIERIELGWQLAARVWLHPAQALAVRARLLEALRDDAFAPLAMAWVLPFGREGDPQDPARARAPAAADDAHQGTDDPARGRRVGLVLRAAASAPPPNAALAPLRALLELDGVGVLAYDDPRRAQQRRLSIDPRRNSLIGYWLAGDSAGHESLDTLVLDGVPLSGPAHRLLAPGGLRAAMTASPARSRQVCNCLDVDEASIVAGLSVIAGDDETRLRQIQARLGCGTQCGSCLPQVRSLVRAARHEDGAVAR